MHEIEKAITCGIIITDTRGYLICHPTRSKWWDIPKGQMEPGESYVETAIRELREETGLVVAPEQLTLLGKYNYKPKKDLVLYYWQVDIMFNIELMSCSATVEKNGIIFPEMDKFKIVTKNDMIKQVNPSLSKLLTEVLK